MALLDALLYSATRRWYVLLFLAAYLVIALRHLGPRRTALFTAVAAGLSWISEVPSIRWGFPYGLYLYLWGEGGVDPREPSLLGVPCFSTLSYVFLNYASFCAALVLVGRERPRAALALVSAACVVALDMVIDPVALRGERWFLGRIYHYPGGGEHFGVPVTNYAGWLLVGFATASSYLALEPRVAAPRPAAGGPALGTALWLSIAAFNVGVTFWIGEREIAWASVGTVAPLLALVAARMIAPEGEKSA